MVGWEVLGFAETAVSFDSRQSKSFSWILNIVLPVTLCCLKSRGAQQLLLFAETVQTENFL